MTFPETPLDMTVEIDAGGWTDITATVFDRDGSGSIRVERGRKDWASQTQRGMAVMTLNNAEGRFAPRNPMGPYYGLIGRNTPLRIYGTPGTMALSLPGRATALDTSALGVTGDIDIRIDLTPTSWTLRDLCGKYVTTGDQRSWVLQVDADGLLVFRWSTGGTLASSTTVSSTASIPTALGRLAIRVTLDVNNGASGNTVTFYTSDTIAGSWTQLGSTVVNSGTTSVFDSTSPIELGEVEGIDIIAGTSDSTFPIEGDLHAFELRDGIAGTVVANPDFSAQARGATSFADTASAPNTWTISDGAVITDGQDRFNGEVSEWPVSWEASGNDVWTQIEASGILRRLGQGAAPLRSTMFRGIALLSSNPAAVYFPMEDGDGSTQWTSGLGGAPAAMTGSPELASSDLYACSEPLPVLGTGSLSAAVPPYTATGFGQIRWLMNIPSSGPTDGAILLRFHTNGTAARWDLRYNAAASGTITLLVYDGDGSLIHTAASPAIGRNDQTFGAWVNLTQDGSDIDYEISYTQPGEAVTIETGTVTSRTFGRVTNVRINPTGNLANVTFGHLSVHPLITENFELSEELAAYDGEPAGQRFRRLCAEEGITCRSIGDLHDTAPMGVQTTETLLTLLQECVDADLGIMYEPREVLGLGYRTRKSLYNQTSRIELDYAAGELAGPLDPVDDDQLVRNDITATRKGGSSYRVEVTDGPLSVNKPEDGGVGRYPDTPDVNLEADTDLPHHTGWRAHEGTVDEARYPSLQVNLASDPVVTNAGLVDALLDFELGDRVTVDNPPSWLPPDQISQLVQGYSESMRNFEHKITLNCTPESPYRVGVYDSASLGRGESDGSTLATSIGMVPAVAFVADAETNNTVAGTSCVVAVPTGTKRNDVMVALIGKIDQAAITPPAGWTLIGSQLAGSNVIYEAYYRLATASEPANYTWSWTGSFKNIGWIGSYRNADPLAPILGSASTGTNTPGTAFSTPVPAVTVPAGGGIIRSAFERHAATGATNTWTISSSTERMDAGSNGGSGQDDSHAVYDTTLNVAAAPAVRTVTASQTVSQIALWTIALSPNPTTTEISVATASGPLWTTNADSFPFDVMIGGERMTVEDTDGGFTDTFTRTVSNGWGTADTGAVWSVTGGSALDYSVNGSSGLVSLGVVNERHFTVTPAGSDVTIYDSVTVPVTATGASISGGYVARYTDDQNFYLYQILHDTAGTIDLQIVKRVAGSFTTIASASNTIPYTPNVPTHVRCLCSGSTLAVKIWADGDAEPAEYQLTGTDTEFTSGQVGTHSTLLTSNTNTLPVVVTYDNIRVVSAGITGTTSPQAFKVVRSVNGVVKSHSSGTAVALFQPVYYAL